ncbi:MAG: hypothetical protein LCH54_11175 [Bacteroidetes bacterium]|nr:hypothetical protein [Bacteroidota bacterium]
MFKTEYNYVKNNLKELIEKFSGKVLVLDGANIIGTYDTIPEAVQKTIKTGKKPGEFFVQKIFDTPEKFTVQYYGSNATFKSVFEA